MAWELEIKTQFYPCFLVVHHINFARFTSNPPGTVSPRLITKVVFRRLGKYPAELMWWSTSSLVLLSPQSPHPPLRESLLMAFCYSLETLLLKLGTIALRNRHTERGRYCLVTPRRKVKKQT